MERGQIHTLEAFLGALLVVGALLFATQATAVTPLSASTSNQHVENQHAEIAADLLRLTADSGSLSEALRYWNATTDEFQDTARNRTVYTEIPPTGHPLREELSTAFGTGERAYNIDARFQTADNRTIAKEIVSMGTPSDHAVSAVRTVTLYEGDTLSAGGFEDQELRNVSDEFWAPNINSSSSLYNIVEVRITVWRM